MENADIAVSYPGSSTISCDRPRPLGCGASWRNSCVLYPGTHLLLCSPIAPGSNVANMYCSHESVGREVLRRGWPAQLLRTRQRRADDITTLSVQLLFEQELQARRVHCAIVTVPCTQFWKESGEEPYALHTSAKRQGVTKTVRLLSAVLKWLNSVFR